MILGLGYGGFITFKIMDAANSKPLHDAEVMIILGAQVVGDLPASPSVVLQERLDAGVAYLLANHMTRVVVTGGQGKDESEPEAEVMKRYLLTKGIDAERILVDNTSTSTVENLTNAVELAPANSYVLVTSDYHMARALLSAQRLGIKNVSGCPAPSESTYTMTGYLREILALGYTTLFK